MSTSSKLRSTADRLLSLWVVLLLLGTVPGFLGGLWWVFALAAHFRVQLTAAALIALAAAVGLRTPRRGAAAAVLVAVNVLPILIGLGGAPQTPADDQRITVVGLNVNTFAGDPARVLAWLNTVDADLVALTEVSPTWMRALSPLEVRWPYLAEAPHDGNFGLALFSRHAISAPRIERLAGHPIQSLHATVHTPLGAIDTVVMHPPPPIRGAWAAMRDAQIAALAAQVRGPTLVIGDLNATPWARALDPLFDAGLRHGRVGIGIQPTWPDGWWPVSVPIDHVLVRELIVTAHRVGPSVGSDHRPIVVTLGRP
jgi:endonuclease/exonuclease/phosphatase (EEP) superfamily protein YafD